MELGLHLLVAKSSSKELSHWQKGNLSEGLIFFGETVFLVTVGISDQKQSGLPLLLILGNELCTQRGQYSTIIKHELDRVISLSMFLPH